MLRTCSLLVLCLTVAYGSQMEPRTLISPINGKPFTVVDIPVTSGSKRVLGVEGTADMGTDVDGCRHSSGPSEYEYYVVTCPYSYFSALGIEYGMNGRLNARLNPEFKEWVLSKDGFHSEWVIDKDRFYHRAQRIARAKGESIPSLHEWVIPQQMIPLEKKYRTAQFCYKKRGATDAFLGKLALTAAWAVRTRLNKPLSMDVLKPGIEEVNERISRLVVDGEEFELEKFYEAYKGVFNSGRLSDEGYFMAGMAYLGFALRMGNLQESFSILDDMQRRYDDKSDDLHKLFRGLIRDRRGTIKVDYLGFLDTSVKHLTRALANEEFARSKIPEILLVVGESHRRMGSLKRAYDWYLALSDLQETKPRLREQIREAGRVPSVDASYPVLLGWRADEAMAQLEANGVEHSGDIAGPDTKLLNAIVVEGLGTLAYENPRWQPRSDGSHIETTEILRDVGLGVLDFVERSGEWPAELGELWTSGVMPNRNRYNRFHCVVTGKPLTYSPLGGPLRGLAKNTVVVTTSAPVPTDQGPRFGAFLADLSVVWTAEPLSPGDLHEP